MFLGHFNPRFTYGTYQQTCFIDRWPGLVLERIAVFAACSNTCFNICHWLLLCSFGRGAEGEQEGLKPCSELPFGFGGGTGAAVPVFCTVAPCLHVFLHLLVITVDMPMDVVHVFASGNFLSSLPCFTCSSLMTMQ